MSKVRLKPVFSVSPGSSKSISRRLELGGLVKGSEDRSIALGLAIYIAIRGSRLKGGN